MAHLDDDLVADGDALRGVIHFNDIACRFHTGCKRQWRLELVLAGGHQHIGEIEPGGADGDAHLARLQRRGRHLFQPQGFGRAELAADDDPRHQAALAFWRCNASRISGRRSLPKYMSVLSMKMVGEPKPPRAITSSVLTLSWSLIAWSAIPARNFAGSMPTLLQMSDSTASCEMSLSPPQ